MRRPTPGDHPQPREPGVDPDPRNRPAVATSRRTSQPSPRPGGTVEIVLLEIPLEIYLVRHAPTIISASRRVRRLLAGRPCCWRPFHPYGYRPRGRHHYIATGWVRFRPRAARLLV